MLTSDLAAEFLEDTPRETEVKKLASLFALLLTLCVLSTACSVERRADAQDASETDERTEEQKKEDETVPVEVAALERGPMEAVLRFSTNLEAEDEVGVYAEASRQVKQLLAEEGQRVRRGQVLLRLQSDEQRTTLAKVQSQLDRAQREYERQKNLYRDELISEQEFNEQTYELEQMELSLEEARRALSYTEVRAPISGTITQRRVNLGDQITVNQHLFDIVDFNSIVARVYVPEKELGRLEEALPARITAPALGSKAYNGSVLRLSPIVDPASGTVKVTVAIPASEGLRPGLYVDVDLVVATEEQALRVPKRALVYDEEQVFVYRMTADSKVERVPLVPLLEDKDFVLPESTLDAGDELVVAGQAGLKDGAKVRRIGAAVQDLDESVEGDEAEVAQGAEA